MPADMPVRVHVYVWLLLALTLSCLAVLLPPLDWTSGEWSAAAVLIILGAVGYSWFVTLPTRGTISFGFIVSLAAIPLLGMTGALLVGTAASALQFNGWTKVVRAFNSAQFGLASLCAAVVYVAVGGSTSLAEVAPGDFVVTVVLPFFLASVVHCLVNVVLLSGVVHLHKGASFWGVVVTTLRHSESDVGYALFGLLLAVLWEGAEIGPLSAVLVLAPLYVARWAWSQFDEQQKAYDRTVRALVRAVETKDLYTRGHSERVSQASVMIAGAIGMGEQRTENLRFAGILHDVGKIGVPTRVLQKTGRLTETDFAAIALHPVRGVDMVRDIEFLSEAYDGILHHHERLDGRGYPMGLTADEIPEFARIIAVADAFDSMTSRRSYRQAMPVADAVEELRRCAGTQFEPRFVDALVVALAEDPWTVAQVTPSEDEPAAGGVTPTFDHDDPAVELPARARRPAPVPRREIP